jgi:5-deoxy-D-glucuronate isomerase
MSSTLTADHCVVRGTHRKMGRTRSLDPRTTAAQQLHYGRIALAGGEALAFGTETLETGLVALGGSARVTAAGRSFEMGPLRRALPAARHRGRPATRADGLRPR